MDILNRLRSGEVLNTDTPRIKAYPLMLEAAAEIEGLRAECEALRKDAERYRWLRTHGNAFYNCTVYQGIGAAVDAAIDAAMAAQEPQS